MWLDPLPPKVPAHKRQAGPKRKWWCPCDPDEVRLPADTPAALLTNLVANTKSEARAVLKGRLKLDRLPPHTMIVEVT